jgi:hypothetical protein
MTSLVIAVEDPLLAELIELALARWGYAVGAPGDLLITDDLRRARGSLVPVLLLADREVEGMSTLLKPFDIEELRWEVARATGGRSGRRSGPPVLRRPRRPR